MGPYISSPFGSNDLSGNHTAQGTWFSLSSSLLIFPFATLVRLDHTGLKNYQCHGPIFLSFLSQQENFVLSSLVGPGEKFELLFLGGWRRELYYTVL